MNTQPKNILIIDDDSKNIFALKVILASRGYSCYTSLSAKEGIDMLLNNTGIKIVLMDMMMSEMDGYEALKIIRNNNKLSFLFVIAVTAQAMVGDREKCLQAGANDYISKPIDVDLLLGKLNNY
ncbi:MAG: response regulator [Segetibacter sp.]